VDCSQVFGCLSAELDGELPTSEAEVVRQHIAGCDACTRRRRLLEQTRWAVRTTRADGAEPTTVVQRRDRHHRAWLAAAMIVLATIGFVAPHYLQPPSSMPDPAVDSFNLATRVPTAPLLGDSTGGSNVRPGADCGLSVAVVCYLEIPCANAACRPDGELARLHEFVNTDPLIANQ
jgi:anti-sigma factor RsiW